MNLVSCTDNLICFSFLKTAAGTDSLKVMEGNVEFQKATLNQIRKRFSDTMYGSYFIHE
jgi:hypothetical protein